WKVMTDRPTTSGSRSRTSRSTVSATRSWTRMRSATATEWCGSTLPAREVRAPLGIRMATGAMCSNESGIERRRTFTATVLAPRMLRPRARRRLLAGSQAVLGPEREPPQGTLDRGEHACAPGEEDDVTPGDELEAGVASEASQLPATEQNGVGVERTATHRQA